MCPVISLVSYLLTKTPTEGPLFRFKDGHPLTSSQRVEAAAVIEALQKVGIDQSRYCGHSYRNGAAMTAAKRECPIKCHQYPRVASRPLPYGKRLCGTGGIRIPKTCSEGKSDGNVSGSGTRKGDTHDRSGRCVA